MPPKHGEQTKIYTKRTSIMPSSSTVPVSTLQSGENTLPSNDVIHVPVLSNSSSNISHIGLVIALRKGKLTCTSHLLSNFICYSCLSSSSSAFIFLWTHIWFPSLYQKPFYPIMERCHAWGNEGFRQNKMWDIVSLPPAKQAVSCR